MSRTNKMVSKYHKYSSSLCHDIIKQSKDQYLIQRKRANMAPEYPKQMDENKPGVIPMICLCGSNLDLHEAHNDNCIFKN